MVPGSGRYPGAGNGNRLQDSCLKNSMDRRAWWAAVHRVSKSWTLKELSTAQWHTHIMSSANSDCLASSFPTWDSFYFIFFFSDIIRISIAMLNKSGESGHLCLIPDLRGNVFGFLPLV